MAELIEAPPQSWRTAKCGQCEFARELSYQERIKMGGLQAPRVMDCWKLPPQMQAVQQQGGQVGMMPVRFRAPLEHPACGSFVYDPVNSKRMKTPQSSLIAPNG